MDFKIFTMDENMTHGVVHSAKISCVKNMRT